MTLSRGKRIWEEPDSLGLTCLSFVSLVKSRAFTRLAGVRVQEGQLLGSGSHRSSGWRLPCAWPPGSAAPSAAHRVPGQKGHHLVFPVGFCWGSAHLRAHWPVPKQVLLSELGSLNYTLGSKHFLILPTAEC